MHKETARRFGIGFLVGALVGLAIGMLYAPRSGEETRAMIRGKLAKTESVIKQAKAKTAELRE